MEDGIIPANLHYETPNLDIPALSDGRFKVVSDHTPWDGGYVGINSFGFGGSNVHSLLKSKPKEAVVTQSSASKYRLATFAGRTKEGKY